MGWHSEKERAKIGFNEWVYFNFFSSKIDGIIIYGCANGHPGVLSAQMFPKTESQVPSVINDYNFSLDDVEKSKDSYDINIGESSLISKIDNAYIAGLMEDKENSIKWGLDYNHLIPSIDNAFEENFGNVLFGNLFDEYIGWKIFSPKSSVKGKVEVNGKMYDVDGYGYNDSNYGRWLVAIDFKTHWNWITAFNCYEKYCVLGMNIRNEPEKGALYFSSDSESVEFKCNKDTFKHLEFESDKKTGIMKPVKTLIVAENDEGYKLEALADNYKDYIFEQKLPFPLSFIRWSLIENFVDIKGHLNYPNGFRKEIEARGLKEYGVTSVLPDWLRKIFRRFD